MGELLSAVAFHGVQTFCWQVCKGWLWRSGCQAPCWGECTIHPGAVGHTESAWLPCHLAQVGLRAMHMWGLWETAWKQVSEAVVRVEKKKNTNHCGKFWMHLHGDTHSLISGKVTEKDSMGVYNSPARQHGASPFHCALGHTETLSKTFSLPATKMPLRKAVRLAGSNNEQGEVGHQVSQSHLIPCNQHHRKQNALLWEKQAGTAGPKAWRSGEHGAPLLLSPTAGHSDRRSQGDSADQLHVAGTASCHWDSFLAARDRAWAPRCAPCRCEPWPPLGLCTLWCRGRGGMGTVHRGDDVCRQAVVSLSGCPACPDRLPGPEGPAHGQRWGALQLRGKGVKKEQAEAQLWWVVQRTRHSVTRGTMPHKEQNIQN